MAPKHISVVMMNERTYQTSRPAIATASPTALARLRDRAAFFCGFVRSPAQVGSVVPSSPRLEQRLVEMARIAQARTVVELGPGTGGTTAAFLRALPAAGRLLAIELDATFHRHLSNTLPDARLSVQYGSAEHLQDFLEMHRLGAPDAIVSGIPFSTMPPDVADRIAGQIAQVLRPGGRFVAYQVRARVADFVTPHMGEPVRAWEFVNVPPVRVFAWDKR